MRTGFGRFTPTRVGTTCSLRLAVGSPPVHPHARGDNCTCQLRTPGHTPVHPHARGDNVSTHRPAIGSLPVHPHARGDNAVMPLVPMRHRPVHPHARGDNDTEPALIGPSSRFTPTRVGTTLPKL